MIKMSLAKAAAVLGAEQIIDKEFTGISIDSRTLQPGNLFFAIHGEKLDGHDFIHLAKEKGAAGAIVKNKRDIPELSADFPQIVVEDTTLALGTLSAYWRDQFTLPIFAVTGSNGKTTLKNMLAAIFTAACDGDDSKVLATKGNFNNYWGLPITLAQLNKNHRYAAIEMGMNQFGEIKYLTRLTRPQVVLITNAATAHLQGVGDIAGVARAKAEIFLGLDNHGIAILNKDDAFFDYWREQVGHKKFISFGFNKDADVTLTKHDLAQKQQLTIRTPKGDLEINLPLLGKHNVLNTLAAVASSIAMGIDFAAIKNGLENILPAPGRLQLRQLENGAKIIDDTYNANPISLQAAVETLALFAGKKILVLGDMKELGNDAKKLHQTAGEKIRAAGIDYLFTYGELSATTAEAFGEGAYHFNEQEKLVTALKPLLHQQTTILIKGSRSMRMEKVVAGLVQ